MADEPYSEPTNKQLANFLMVYADQLPELRELVLDPLTLERLMNHNPRFRAGALQHHRRFQERLDEHSRKMMEGELQCEYILKKKKRCPNYNKPGSIYCGLHIPPEEVAPDLAQNSSPRVIDEEGSSL